MKSLFFLWLIILASTPTGLGQTPDSLKPTAKVLPAVPKWTTGRIIDFRLSPHNNMVVKTTLNDIDDCDLMFHTAVDGVSLTSTSTPTLKSVKFTHEANTVAWGGKQKTRFSPTNRLRIGSLKWADISISEDRFSGIGTDGKFGWGLFENEIVEIDFDRQQLRLHSKLPRVEGYEKFETTYDRGGMMLTCQVSIDGTQISHPFLMHSGFSGTALFDDDFTAKQQLHDRWQTSAGRELKDSLGNIIHTSRAIVPSMKLGISTLKDVPAELFPGNIGSQKQSVLGGDLLKRFNMIVDINGKAIYLKPNRSFKAKYAKS